MAPGFVVGATVGAGGMYTAGVVVGRHADGYRPAPSTTGRRPVSTVTRYRTSCRAGRGRFITAA
jgi:hypothetical protein